MDSGDEDLRESTVDITDASDSYTNIDSEVNHGGFGNITCFNCQGSHNMRQCKFPRDDLRIKANQRRQDLGSIGLDRYHKRESFAEEHPNIRPGKFSPSLLGALGLRKDKIPEFIYRMRDIGYPPGWLKAAEIKGSGLEVFDQENLDSTSCLPPPKFNPGKIIDFVGFNVGIPPNWPDEHHMYNCPALMNHNLKQNWGKFIHFSTPEVVTGSLKANSPFSLMKPSAFSARISDGMEGDEKGLKEEPFLARESPTAEASGKDPRDERIDLLEQKLDALTKENESLKQHLNQLEEYVGLCVKKVDKGISGLEKKMEGKSKEVQEKLEEMDDALKKKYLTRQAFKYYRNLIAQMRDKFNLSDSGDEE